jgi:hypothetical protein
MNPIDNAASVATAPVKPRRGWRKPLAIAGGVVFVLYCAAFAGFDYAMHQPPENFGRVMMHTGPAPFLLFPFETMWKHARAGRLHTGDEAPDFMLPQLDGSQTVSLASFRGKQPVVLIFGSYT